MTHPASSPLAVIILAAGKGTRMKSALPKVLHPVAGAPMIAHVVNAALGLAPQKVVVVTGFGAEAVETYLSSTFPAAPLTFVRQEQQNGTGHAVMRTEPVLKDFPGTILIFSGDSLLPERADVLPELLKTHTENAHTLTLLAAKIATPRGSMLGRVFMEENLLRVVEEKDCTDPEKDVPTVNTSFYAVDSALLWKMLPLLSTNNAQKEYYLTDIVELAGKAGHKVGMAEVPAESEEIGMNNRTEIAQMEALWQSRKRHEMMMAGVTLLAPETVFFSADTRLAADVTVGQNVVFGPGVTVESGVEILPFCHLEGCTIRTGARIGPYARLRPGADIGEEAHIGNFVELKNTVFGARSKANHFAYVGDATLGTDCNLGAMLVTANYNHFTKQKFATNLGNHVATGSMSVLLAPVTIGDNVYIGAGTTVRKDIPSGALAVSKSEFLVKETYQPKMKEGALSKKK